MEFKTFKKIFQDNVKNVINGQQPVYLADISKDQLWETYISSFPEEEKQGYSCNSCRQFIKNYSNLVTIVDNKLVSIWKFESGGYYQQVIDNMNFLVTSATIRDTFVTKIDKLGTDSNVQRLDSGETIRWDHFYFVYPKTLVSRDSRSEESIQGEVRDSKNVFKRSLEELTIDATETVLDLISQNSLYRGAEFKGLLDAFLKLQKQYALLPTNQKDNFCWVNGANSSALSKIRNTSIGTLLIDISKGEELDKAVRSFERVVAPTNYQRPTAIFTKRMVEEAEAKLNELGLTSALDRRFATLDDLTVNNILFVNRESKLGSTGLFAEMKADSPVNPKTFSKQESVTLDKFIKDILPNSTSVELLLENKHEPNLVSLIAPVDPDSLTMFKWDNRFSWSYNNALADSMKERVKQAGGKIDGVLRFSIQWNEDGKSICDLDAHCIEPNRNHISYSNNCGNPSLLSGMLDVDMRSPTTIGVENIVWSNQSKMEKGKYQFYVENFNGGMNDGFRAEIEFNGETYSFDCSKKLGNKDQVNVAVVTYDGYTFTINDQLPSNSAVKSKDMWNLKTNQFQKVTAIMNSPNHWDEQGVGNKHVFFMLDKANNTGLVRGFYNEFLNENLSKQRKVFESLASRLKVQPSENQLSGVGFSETQRNEFICRVTGKFSRTIRITV